MQVIRIRSEACPVHMHSRAVFLGKEVERNRMWGKNENWRENREGRLRKREGFLTQNEEERLEPRSKFL